MGVRRPERGPAAAPEEVPDPPPPLLTPPGPTLPADTRSGSGPEASDPDGPRHLRVFGSAAYLRLWLVQVCSAFGDWLGLLAIIELARRVGGTGGGGAAAISLVLIPRILPGLFLGTAGGVIVDRLDRRRLMIVCDLARAAIVLAIPVVDSLVGLIVASFLLEVFTSLWGPAKEAMMPNVVPAEHLTTANSLNLVAAYGTFPLAAAAFAGLAKLGEALDDVSALDALAVTGERLALGVDAVTFVVAAALVWTLPLAARTRRRRTPAGRGDRPRRRLDLGAGLRDLREGWRFIVADPVVRAVMVALGTGMIGGGMLLPLGGLFSEEVLGAGDAAFGLLVFALGSGVAVGVGALSAVQRRVPKEGAFATAVLVAGLALAAAASVSESRVVFLLVVLLGIAAGAVYVLGFTLLHETVDDELRGRIFSALYTMVRFCVLIAIGVGPLVAGALDVVSDRLVGGEVDLGIGVLVLPGVRLALWLAAALMLLAWVLAVRSLRAARS